MDLRKILHFATAIVPTILLAVIYFCIVTPLGIFLRLRGHDPLSRKKQKTETYWEPHEKTKSMRHQY